MDNTYTVSFTSSESLLSEGHSIHLLNRNLQLYHVGQHSGVMCGQRLDAIGRKALLTNPLERLALQLFVKRDTRGNHVAPRLRGVATIGKEQNVFVRCIFNL